MSDAGKRTRQYTNSGEYNGRRCGYQFDERRGTVDAAGGCGPEGLLFISWGRGRAGSRSLTPCRSWRIGSALTSDGVADHDCVEGGAGKWLPWACSTRPSGPVQLSKPGGGVCGAGAASALYRRACRAEGVSRAPVGVSVAHGNEEGTKKSKIKVFYLF